MDTVYARCAGADVHKKTVVVCVIVPDEHGGWHKETRTFGTMTADLLALSDWLQQWSGTHVAMESTGDYWKPIFSILEGNFEVLLVNAYHIKAVPGRKTDVSDAEWIAELLRHGLLRASFIPPAPQRALRDLTRFRSTFIRERATLANRVQKVLEDANLKLASVASDVMGISGRTMLAALLDGQTDPAVLANLARSRLRKKRADLIKALTGRLQAHHRFILTELLCQIDNLDEAIAQFDEQIREHCVPFEDAVALLDTIPGVARATAEVIVAEIGTDMSRFPSAAHLAAWAGVAPGNDESAGKRRSGKTRKGDRPLGVALNQAAHGASPKNTYLAAQYRRLAKRRGKKKAIMAVAHSILVIAYHLILRKEPYRELGGDYFDTRRPEAATKHLVKRLEQLGYSVMLQPQTTTAVA